MSDDLAFAPAVEQAALIRSGRVSPAELVELYARRIESLNPTVGAYLTLCLDRAMDEAREVARAIAVREDLPPFAGVPISIKDLSDTEDVVTTYGSAAFADHVPAADEESVARIRRAGFIVLGKTNTSEFGSVPWTEPAAFVPCRNPWDLERSSGGSSGGAAAAVATGMCPVAQGSDSGGSIRIPASVCGVYGIRPSRGRVSLAPRSSNLLSQRGPISRSVADAAALLDILSGPAPGDQYWAPAPARPFREEAGADHGRLRIAFTTKPIAPVDVSAANRAAVEQAAKLLEELGHVVTEQAVPASEDLLVRFPAIWSVVLASREPAPDLDRVEPLNRTLIEMGRQTTAPDDHRTWAAIQRAVRPVAEFFEGIDVLLTPTVASPPPLIGQFKDEEQPLMELIRAGSFAPFTSVWNLTGQPAASVPWGHDELGLPVGIQLIGRPTDEATLLRLSMQIEQARPWADRRAPVADPSHRPAGTG